MIATYRSFGSCSTPHPKHGNPCTKLTDHLGSHQAYIGGIGLLDWWDTPSPARITPERVTS